MNPYAPPKAAENIMNERIAPVSQRWRRVKWCMRNLIRKNRRIANTPEIALSRARPAVGVRDRLGVRRVLEEDDETATLQIA